MSLIFLWHFMPCCFCIPVNTWTKEEKMKSINEKDGVEWKEERTSLFSLFDFWKPSSPPAVFLHAFSLMLLFSSSALNRSCCSHCLCLKKHTPLHHTQTPYPFYIFKHNADKWCKYQMITYLMKMNTVINCELTVIQNKWNSLHEEDVSMFTIIWLTRLLYKIYIILLVASCCFYLLIFS